MLQLGCSVCEMETHLFNEFEPLICQREDFVHPHTRRRIESCLSECNYKFTAYVIFIQYFTQHNSAATLILTQYIHIKLGHRQCVNHRSNLDMIRAFSMTRFDAIVLGSDPNAK